MRVGFISQYFDPESGSAAIPGGIARSLSKRGVQLQVVTGFPNYPFGRIYPGYRQRLRQRSTFDDSDVIRVPLWPDHSRGAIARSRYYLSFAMTSTCIGLPSIDKPDCYFAYASPVTSAIGPLLWGKASDRPVLTYVPDLWPDSVIASGIQGTGRLGRLIERSLSATSEWVYRHSRLVVATSDLMRMTLIERGVDQDRIHTIHNWVDESLFFPRAEQNPILRAMGLEDAFIVLYAGNMGELQDVMSLLKAAFELRHRDDIAFLFVGDGDQRDAMLKMAQAEALRNVHFLKQQDLSSVASLLASSDVQLVSLVDSPSLRMTIPSKIQYGMASGTPAIAVVSGAAAEFVERFQAGILVSVGNPSSLADSIAQLASRGKSHASMLGLSAFGVYQTHLSERVAGDSLTNLMRAMLD